MPAYVAKAGDWEIRRDHFRHAWVFRRDASDPPVIITLSDHWAQKYRLNTMRPETYVRYLNDVGRFSQSSGLRLRYVS